MDTATPRPSIHTLTFDELRARLVALGEPAYRAQQLCAWLYTRRAPSFDTMTDLPAALRARLAAEFSFTRLEPLRVLGAADTTQKFLFRLNDGNAIESVLIPASPGEDGRRAGRHTLCVSTQVGCAYGCRFCASGLDGWTRHLDAAEIAGQLAAVEACSGARVHNLVFMGMGEPFANYANLLRAITLLNASWGYGIGARHMTVSTSGLAPQIRRFAAEPLQVRLAVSLHGATDAVRSQILPVNRKYPLAELLDACAFYVRHKKQMLTFEFILIEGVNDSLEQAEALAGIARRLEAKVNLIPCNPVPGLPWRAPPADRQEAFLRVLSARRVPATIRREKGQDIDAACGQLRRHTPGAVALRH